MSTTNTFPASVLTRSQFKDYPVRTIKYKGHALEVRCRVRYDDQCGNGHNSFAITGSYRDSRGSWDQGGGGCIHEEIAAAFPELAPLIKWHHMTAGEPMHYIPNTVYHAGDRDHWGLRKGEFRQHLSRGPLQAEGVAGVPCWELVAPKGTQKEIYSSEKPAPVVYEWQPNGITGEGKARELDHARASAVWPEATDAELSAEPEVLKAALLARLPALIADFKAAVESLGFTY